MKTGEGGITVSIKDAFRFRLTTMGIVMIPVAVAINYVGKEVANVLNLPMWLDSIGTILAAVIAGPWIGAISGAVNNVFFGLTMDGGMSIIYGLTSIAIAIVAGILAHLNWFRSLPKSILAGIVLAIVASVVSTPLNIAIWSGQTGKALGDAIFAAMMASHLGIWFSSWVDEVTMDLIDKIVVCIVVYFILLGLPKSFLQSFRSSNKTIRA
jgi:energy-coupling factor transport system substrate-specific component